jgi:rubrerythrin
MDLRNRNALAFTRNLVSTPRGRAYVLNQVAHAEGSDEGRVFSKLREKVDDEKLARMIEKHEADEVRHAALFNERLRANGFEPEPVPEHLKLLERLDRKLGVFSRPIEDERDVMEAYLLLQVIEERALHQFAIMIAAFRPVDPETARVFEEVARDEDRHLRYCHAISRRYAPSEAVRIATLARFRVAEAEAFRDNGNANMRHVLANVFEPSVQSLGWSVVASLTGRSTALPLTRFGRESTDYAAAA